MIRHASSSDAGYLRGRLQEARWLLKSLEARGDTLLKVVRCLIRQQSGFLEFGEQALRPLTLREVAAEVGLHESTVSRAIARKYVRTPRGTLPLRASSPPGIGTEGGGEASSTAIQSMIRADRRREPAQAAVRREAGRYAEGVRRAGGAAHRGEIPRGDEYIARRVALNACASAHTARFTHSSRPAVAHAGLGYPVPRTLHEGNEDPTSLVYGTSGTGGGTGIAASTGKEVETRARQPDACVSKPTASRSKSPPPCATTSKPSSRLGRHFEHPMRCPPHWAQHRPPDHRAEATVTSPAAPCMPTPTAGHVRRHRPAHRQARPAADQAQGKAWWTTIAAKASPRATPGLSRSRSKRTDGAGAAGAAFPLPSCRGP
jgi:hypothetical protein